MRKLKINSVWALALAACLTGCGYEKDFEYMTEAKLIPTDKHGIGGSVVMGYGMHYRPFTIRIALRGLDQNVKYHVRFYDGKSCKPSDLARASRIDAARDPYADQETWAFQEHPALVSGNWFGFAKEEFELKVPRTTSYSQLLAVYPTVVIAAQDTSTSATAAFTNVACGTILSPPTNRMPHM